MDVVIDTSALIAVIVGKSERNRIVEFTTGNTLIGPGSIPWEIGNALKISKQANMYAYDSYFLDCAIRHKAPLLTLDQKLKKAAQNLNIETMEV